MATDLAEEEVGVDTEIEAESEVSTEESAETSGRKIDFGGKRFKILALLAVAMVGEAGVIFFLVPAPVNTQTKAGGDGEGLSAADSEQGDLSGDVVEVEVSSFNVTNSRATQSAVVHVRFRLVAIVSKDQEFPFKDAALRANEARVKQAVVKVVRSSSLDDLNDPNLSTTKRLIREEINKVLRKSYIIEVVISDFTTMEQ